VGAGAGKIWFFPINCMHRLATVLLPPGDTFGQAAKWFWLVIGLWCGYLEF